MSQRPELMARLNRLRERTADPAQVCGDGILDDAREVLRLTDLEDPGEEFMVDVTAAVGGMFWARYLAAPATAPDHKAARIAARWYGRVYPVRPDDVPDQVIRLLPEIWREEAEELIQRGDPASLDRAAVLMAWARLAWARHVDNADAADGAELGILSYTASQGRGARYRLTGDPGVLEEAISLAADAVRLTRDDAVNHCVVLSHYGMLLRELFLLNGDADVLASAVERCRESVARAPDGYPHMAFLQAHLASSLNDVFLQSGGAGALREAVALGREARAATPPGQPGSWVIFSGLSNHLHELYRVTTDLTILDEAIDAARHALEEGPTGQDPPPGALINLGLALQSRHDHLADRHALDEALQCAEWAARLSAAFPYDRARCLGLLADVQMTYYDRDGTVALLDKALANMREAVSCLAPSSPERPLHLSALASGLWKRYAHGQERRLLDEAIALAREARAALPPDNVDYTSAGNTLAAALAERQARSPDAGDVREAAEISDEGLAAPGVYTSLPSQLSLSAVVGRLRYGASRYDGDLDAAIRNAREAIALTSPGPARVVDMSNLALMLGDRYLRDRAEEDLDEAVDLLRTAAADCPQGGPERAKVLLNLGILLFHRSLLRADPRDRAENLHAHQEVALMTLAPAWARAEAARKWGLHAADDGNWDDAARAFGLAMSLLPRLTPRGARRDDSEFQLSRQAALACDTAGSILQVNGPDAAAKALGMLELGRGVLLAQALEDRSDLPGLDKLAPDLARRLQQLRNRQDAVVPAEEWDSLMSQIRAVTGLESFLEPPSVNELRQAAGDGPVVVINVTDFRSDAFILTPGGLRVLPLTSLTLAAVEDRLEQFQEGLEIIRRPEATRFQRMVAGRSVLEVFEWLWDAITAPVLDVLGLTQSSVEDADLPRVWWCPTGPLNFLPIHAAGRYPEGPSAIDRVVSSYTPTVTALLNAQSQAEELPVRPTRKMMVALPQTPGKRDLPSAIAEAAQFGKLFSGARLLCGADATQDSVKDGLNTSAWVHFACHGHSNQAEPSASYLSLHDGPLTLAEITDLRPESAQLAYLSACDTAAGNFRLADESIHIAAAFQLTGFKHVIGTLWPITDKIAAQVSRHFYENLGDSLQGTARHLHSAILELITKRPELRRHPWLWAAYIHVGP